MKALYYQPSCGIAGDMHLAALVNLGVPRDYLVDMLRKLPIQDEFELTFEPASNMGISGLQAKYRSPINTTTATTAPLFG